MNLRTTAHIVNFAKIDKTYGIMKLPRSHKGVVEKVLTFMTNAKIIAKGVKFPYTFEG